MQRRRKQDRTQVITFVVMLATIVFGLAGVYLGRAYPPSVLMYRSEQRTQLRNLIGLNYSQSPLIEVVGIDRQDRLVVQDPQGQQHLLDCNQLERVPVASHTAIRIIDSEFAHPIFLRIDCKPHKIFALIKPSIAQALIQFKKIREIIEYPDGGLILIPHPQSCDRWISQAGLIPPAPPD